MADLPDDPQVRDGRVSQRQGHRRRCRDIKKSVPKGFPAKGDIVVFVDECHRTQSGKLHEAMKVFLPDAMLIGFTGTPLLSKDKQKSIEVFGPHIRTYKYEEAVRDGVVLELRYEAWDIDQNITSQARPRAVPVVTPDERTRS